MPGAMRIGKNCVPPGTEVGIRVPPGTVHNVGCSDWEHCVPPGTAVDNSEPPGTADIEGCEGSECCIPPGIAVCECATWH